MAQEVFTINGADVELLGDPEPNQCFGAPPSDAVCAQQVKVQTIVGSSMALSTVPVTIFSIYKFTKGRPAVGFAALLSAIALGVFGRALFTGAARSFEACRKG